MTAELTMTQKVVAACITALLIWTAWTTNTTATDVKVIQTELKAATSDRYHSADAARDLALRDQRINGLAERVVELERRGK